MGNFSKFNYQCDNQMSFEDYLKEEEKIKWDTGQYMNLPEIDDEAMDITKYIPIGYENAISRKDLCGKTGFKDRKIRELIEEARRDTIIISNNDGSGYWIFPEEPTEKEIEMLKKCALEQENVIGIDKLRTRVFGNRIYVDIEICADGRITLNESHEIAEKVHDAIEGQFPDVKHIMVHVNPV